MVFLPVGALTANWSKVRISPADTVFNLNVSHMDYYAIDTSLSLPGANSLHPLLAIRSIKSSDVIINLQKLKRGMTPLALLYDSAQRLKPVGELLNAAPLAIQED